MDLLNLIKHRKILFISAVLATLLFLAIVHGCQCLPNFVKSVPGNDRWKEWEPIDNNASLENLIYEFAVVNHQDGRLEIFAKDSYSQLWHKYQKKSNDGQWSDWVQIRKGNQNESGNNSQDCIKANFICNRTIFRNDSKKPGGIIEVFALTSSPTNTVGYIYQMAQNSDEWSDWEDLGKPSAMCQSIPTGKFFSNVEAINNINGRSEVFAICLSGGLFHKYQATDAPSSWHTWFNMSFPYSISRFDNFAVGKNEDGRLEVFAYAKSNKTIYHKYQDSPGKGPWHGWSPLCVSPNGDEIKSISVGQNGDGRLELFVHVGFHLYHIYQYKKNAGPWHGLFKLHGEDKFMPNLCDNRSIAVIRNRKTECLEVFAFAKDEENNGLSSLYHIQQKSPNSPWSNWSIMYSIPNGFVRYPRIAVVQNKNDKLEVFTISNNKKILRLVEK